MFQRLKPHFRDQLLGLGVVRGIAGDLAQQRYALDARKAPYKWAAFTLTGADGPVEFEVPWWRYQPVWAGTLGLAALGLWFFRKRKIF